MEKKQNKYLSIGEVAKIMQVSHTSLRYYDELGILKPAYINQDTGYRYYAKRQLPILTLILLAIDLDIPLKEFEQYLREDSSADLEHFAAYAKTKVHKSMNKLQRDLYFIESIEKHFKDNSNLFNAVDERKEYTKQINKRCFLTLSSNLTMQTEFDISEYWSKMTELYMLAFKYELFLSSEQGMIYFHDGNEIAMKFFIEIKNIKKKFIEKAEIISIPKGEYKCSFYLNSCITEATEKFQKCTSFLKGNPLILADIIEKKVGKDWLPFEAQILHTPEWEGLK